MNFIKKYILSLQWVKSHFEKDIRNNCIGYNNWVSSLHKKGFPKKENGMMMNNWELYDYFKSSPEKNTYVNHAQREQISKFK